MTLQMSEFYIFIRMAFTCGTMGMIVFAFMFALNVWGTNQERKARAERDHGRRFTPPPQPAAVVNQPPQITVNHHHYYEGSKTVNLQVEEFDELGDLEWVRQLSTASAPKRITTNQNRDSRRS